LRRVGEVQAVEDHGKVPVAQLACPADFTVAEPAMA
jgi:hypothetical protein